MSNEQKPKQNTVRVGGAWAKTGQYGEYFTVSLDSKVLATLKPDARGNYSLVIGKAKEQKTENSPTHNVTAYTDAPVGQGVQGTNMVKPAVKPAPKQAAKTVEAPEVDDDTIL